MGRGQGDHVGTGQPLTFRCSVERKERDWRTGRCWREHDVKRTGRRRGPEHRTYTRMLSQRHEYVCSCGQRGWSKHSGVLHQPLMELDVPHGGFVVIARSEHSAIVKEA